MDFIHYPWAYSENLEGDVCSLSEEESRHLRNVLRCKQQDPVVIFNGKGAVRLGHLIFKKRNCEVVFTSNVEQTSPADRSFNLVPFLPNNIATFEDILRKTCELGIACIYPVYGERAEPKHWTKEIWAKRSDRFSRILIESCKQAKNPFIPKLQAPTLLKSIAKEDLGYCFHGSLNANDAVFSKRDNQKNISCIIGPEGGFSPQEELYLSEFSQGICLPTCVLRVETAVVGLISVIKTLST